MIEKKVDADHIRLRVAGIFYDREVPVNSLATGPRGIITIEQVMDEARANGKLDYGFEYRAAALELPPVDFKKSMIKIAHRIDGNEFFSLGGKKRSAGLYDLIETKIPGGVVAWQYYVLRGGSSASSNPVGKQVSDAQFPPPPPLPAPQPEGFKPYDKMEVKGGDTIIWRMVAIRILN